MVKIVFLLDGTDLEQGSANHSPRGQIWLMAYFCMDPSYKWFLHFKGIKQKQKQKQNPQRTETTCSAKPKISSIWPLNAESLLTLV